MAPVCRLYLRGSYFGIIQMKYQDEKELLEKENQLLNEQNDFLTLSYEDAAHDRDALEFKRAAAMAIVNYTLFTNA